MKLVFTNSTLEFATKHGWSDQKLSKKHEYPGKYYQGGSVLNSLGGPAVSIYEIPSGVSKVKISVIASNYDVAKDYFLSADVTSDAQTGINQLIIPMSSQQTYIRVGTQALTDQVIDVPVGAKYLIFTTVYQKVAGYPTIYPYYE